MPLLTHLSTFLFDSYLRRVYFGAGDFEPATIDVLSLIGSFAVSILAVIVALGVLVALALDLRALRRGDYGWRPSWAWALGGVVNVAAAVGAPLYAVSLPALGYYLYRRRQRVGAP
ncbi:hypothetical protein [Haloprofundus halobius]|uniref:hypothetical protein n=1 Tax=Haloprofundus halobius TaxID=2876194 RepID=UPI001CCEC24E|nr:hypothetical protein [Haloprofundus halobius]